MKPKDARLELINTACIEYSYKAPIVLALIEKGNINQLLDFPLFKAFQTLFDYYIRVKLLVKTAS